MNSAKYEAALATMNKAQHVYDCALDRYRSRMIGDQEFLAARKVYKEAEAAFDAARGEAP